MKNPFQIKQFFKQIFIPPSSPSYHPTIAGLRALAFLWILTIHCLYFGVALHPSFAEFDHFIANNPVGIFVNGGTYAVDIFLLLSGFLMFETIYQQTIRSGMPNVIALLLSRLWRFLPVILFVSLLVRLGGSDSCPHWSEILMVSNYAFFHAASALDACLGSVWSISLDYQCWVVVAIVFIILTKIRARVQGKWTIKAADFLVLIAIFTAYNIWEAFRVSPFIPPALHLVEYMPAYLGIKMQQYVSYWNHIFPLRCTWSTYLGIKMQQDLNITFPRDIHNPNISQNIQKMIPLAHFYYDLPPRIIPFLYGILAGQIFYHTTSVLSHIHKYSIVYLPFALACVILPIPYSTVTPNPRTGALPYIERNLVLALHRQVITVGTMFFLLLALSSEKSSKIQSPSFLGKITKKFLSLYIWYPISQLSFIAYVNSLMIITVIVVLSNPIPPGTLSPLSVAKTLVLSLVPLLIHSSFIYLFVEMPLQEVKKWIFPSRLATLQDKKSK